MRPGGALQTDVCVCKVHTRVLRGQEVSLPPQVALVAVELRDAMMTCSTRRFGMAVGRQFSHNGAVCSAARVDANRRRQRGQRGTGPLHKHAISESVADFAKKKGRNKMKHRRFSAVLISAAVPIMLFGAAGIAVAKSEIKGAAILDHPCGKVAVKFMGLAHAGKIEDANKLSTKEMQDQWTKMPEKDRTMMSGMMKDMSQTEAQYSADIKANGVLVVDGPSATLTVKKDTKDKSGSSSETMRHKFKIDGSQCLISR
jgi:hypothetical protein